MAQWTCRACTAAYAVGAPACPQCGSTERTEERQMNLPGLRVTCNLQGCRYCGIERDVRLRSAGIGLFEVPTLICAGCGSQLFAACNDLPMEEDNDVPKITVHGGPSNAATDNPPEEVPSSPGTSSSPSLERQPTKPGPSGQRRRSRARTTANRSRTDQTGGSTAPGTGGGQTEPTSVTAADEQ